MDTGHNHPPACCCQNNQDHPEQIDGLVTCPLCPHHGELAQLGRCICGTPGLTYAGPERDCPIHGEPRPGECPICKSEIGKQHTDYCQFTGTVTALADYAHHWPTRTGQPATTTSQPTTHAREPMVSGGYHYAGQAAHPTEQCDPAKCGRTPLTTPTPREEIHHVPTPHPRIGTCTPDCNNTPNSDHPR